MSGLLSTGFSVRYLGTDLFFLITEVKQIIIAAKRKQPKITEVQNTAVFCRGKNCFDGV